MDTPSTSLREWPDRDLVVAFKEGRPGAYEEMYRRYGARVEGVCRRMLGNVEDAHEAAQETFLKAYQALPRFNGNYKLGAWLHRIAANVCLDLLRARTRGAHLVTLPEGGHEAHDSDPGPEELIAAGGNAAAALERIQPLHARALKLRAVDGMSHKEMALALGMTPQQVKALLHRARDSFKRVWESASGWALAPLVGFRSFVEDKQLHTASASMGSITAVGAPLLAEKVAASAMVVAAAIASVASPAASVTTTTASPKVVTAVDPAFSSVAVEKIGATPGSVVEVRVPKSAVAGLIDVVKQTVEDNQTDNRKRRKHDDDDEGGFDPNQASTELVRTVEETIEELPVP